MVGTVSLLVFYGCFIASGFMLLREWGLVLCGCVGAWIFCTTISKIK